jgi:uncharacterized protein YjbI with pentapeptide repeats
VTDPLASAAAPEPRRDAHGVVGRRRGPLQLVPGPAPLDAGSPLVDEADPGGRQRPHGPPRPRFDLGGQTITGLHLRDVILARSSFVDTELHRVRFTDAVILNSDLRAAVFDTAALHRVTFRGCRMVVAMFTRSHLRTVRFERCTLVGASFLHSTLDEVIFDDCDLADAELHPDHAIACRFVSSDLTRLHLVGDSAPATSGRSVEP